MGARRIYILCCINIHSLATLAHTRTSTIRNNRNYGRGALEGVVTPFSSMQQKKKPAKHLDCGSIYQLQSVLKHT